MYTPMSVLIIPLNLLRITNTSAYLEMCINVSLHLGIL